MQRHTTVRPRNMNAATLHVHFASTFATNAILGGSEYTLYVVYYLLQNCQL